METFVASANLRSLHKPLAKPNRAVVVFYFTFILCGIFYLFINFFSIIGYYLSTNKHVSHINGVRTASASNILQPIIRFVRSVQPPPYSTSSCTNLKKIIFPWCTTKKLPIGHSFFFFFFLTLSHLTLILTLRETRFFQVSLRINKYLSRNRGQCTCGK